MATNQLSRESVKWLILEGVAIAIGVLLAFLVDAWWDERKLIQQRAELIVELRSDFESNIETAINVQKDIQLNLGQLELFMAMQDNIETVPIDELTHSARPIFGYHSFDPVLSTYSSAVNSGGIGLIENREFHAAMATMLGRIYELDQYTVTTFTMFYHGPIWELMKSVGTLGVILGRPENAPRHLRLSESRIREILSSRLVMGLATNARLIKRNKLAHLETIEAASRQALRALEN